MSCNVGGKLVIGEKGVVNANVQTVDAIIMGHYDGNMIATGNVEITATGRVSGNITDRFARHLQGRLLQRQRRPRSTSRAGAQRPST